MRTLLIFPWTKHFQRSEQEMKEAIDESPRHSLFENVLNSDVVDEAYLRSGAWYTRILRRLPFVPSPFIKALEVYRQRQQYDVVISWDDRFAVVYALLLMLTRSHARHVALLTWMANPDKAFLLRLVQKHINRIIVWSQSHRDLLVDFFGISSSRIVVIPYQVDQKFWRPLDEPLEGICSVGDSKRDYATLIEAMQGLAMQCRIVTRVKPGEKINPDYDATSNSLVEVTHVPDNVVLGPASLVELRSIYAHSRFVVFPLFPSFQDCGVTAVLESMAMGKAIICSRTCGQIDLVEHGVNGLFVTPGDPQALREAIEYLNEHPDVAARMGAEGRRRAEEIFALDHFVSHVQQIVDDVVTGNQTYNSSEPKPAYATK